MNPEIPKLATEWTNNTVETLKSSISKLKIGDTGDLKASITGSTEISGETVTVRLRMKLKGRFVDMGAGRSQPANTKRTARKAKKFYSRTFYGRLSGLRGAVSFQYVQETRKILKNAVSGL